MCACQRADQRATRVCLRLLTEELETDSFKSPAYRPKAKATTTTQSAAPPPGGITDTYSRVQMAATYADAAGTSSRDPLAATAGSSARMLSLVSPQVLRPSLSEHVCQVPREEGGEEGLLSGEEPPP